MLIISLLHGEFLKFQLLALRPKSNNIHIPKTTTAVLIVTCSFHNCCPRRKNKSDSYRNCDMSCNRFAMFEFKTYCYWCLIISIVNTTSLWLYFSTLYFHTTDDILVYDQRYRILKYEMGTNANKQVTMLLYIFKRNYNFRFCCLWIRNWING